MRLASISAGVLTLGFVATSASAQIGGLPVDYAPAGTGVSIQADFGRGLNNNSGKVNSIGGMVTLGLPMFQISAGVSDVDLSGAKEISFGGNVLYPLPIGGGAPVSVALAAGAGVLNSDIFVPAGVTLSLDVPSPALSITPWVSPQFRYIKFDAGGNDSGFGVSGGIKVGMPMGLGFQAAFDYNQPSKSLVLGVGAHFKVSAPGMGGM
ncbi:MAG TPA: hypothetical protein VGA37_03805 [Gemmatimonadales bacterium]